MSRRDPTYPPLHTLKPVAEDVWIVDGPIIHFGAPWPKMPFPTRMTIVRLPGNELFLHSPISFDDKLAREIADIGRPAWIVGPNRLHYWWIPDWHAAFPAAAVHLAPGVTEQAGTRIGFAFHPLTPGATFPWDGGIATLPVAGGYMTEFVFFHRASRTLIVTDLIENFESDKLDSLLMRCLTRLGGVLDPDGQMPRDMRLSFARRKPELRHAIETMIGWAPERVILAHGRWYERNGTAELRRAFRWLLGLQIGRPAAG